MLGSVLTVLLLGLPGAQASRPTPGGERALQFAPSSTNASILCPLIPFANCTGITASPLELSALSILGNLKEMLNSIPNDVEARIKADLALLADVKLAFELGNLTKNMESQAQAIR